MRLFMSRRISQTILLLFLFIGTSGVSQNERPKVGLVLSGGGAKGLAHIGVLKVLEEVGIRPDYITGASMGSIIGGLYSIGYSTHEIDSIVQTLDWSQLLTDGMQLTDVIPEEKHDYNRFHVELDIEKGKLMTPSGFVQGTSIAGLLSRLSWRTAGTDQFSDYPIPFKCVAVNLVSGEQYIFEGGNFASALQASMAIPSVFSPVRIDSMRLVDGGVLNNFPVTLCKEMGADIIIGVNVGTDLLTDDTALGSPINVLSASAMIGNTALYKQQKPLVDILITPNMEGFSTSSFFDGDEIIQRGDSAARKVLDKLTSLAAKLDSFDTPPPRKSLVDPQSILIKKINIKGLERTNLQFFRNSFQIQEGDTVKGEDLDRGINRLLGTRYFESVTYQLNPLKDGVEIDLQVRESAPARFKFSLHYDNENKAGIIINTTLRNVLTRGNRASATIDISERPRFNFTAINYYGAKQNAATRFELNWENNNFPVYLGDGTTYGIFKHNYFSSQLGFLSTLGTRWEINTYAQIDRSILSSRSGFYDLFYSGVDYFGSSFFTANFSTSYNTLNRRHFPTKGTIWNVQAQMLLDGREVFSGTPEGREKVAGSIEISENNFLLARTSIQTYIPLHKRWVVSPRAEAGFSTENLPITATNYIGGMPFQRRYNEVSFVGFSSRELIVQNYLMAQINLRYRFFRKVNVTATANGIYSKNDQPIVFHPLTLYWDELIWGYGLLLEYSSFLGPIQAGVSKNTLNSGLRWYLGLGYSF